MSVRLLQRCQSDRINVASAAADDYNNDSDDDDDDDLISVKWRATAESE